MIIKALFLGFLIVISQAGCEKRSKTDIAKVHWDRDMCARCVMVVSDRQNTVQVREPKAGKSYMFDDIGCMVLWFKENHIKWQKEAIIWITDVETGKWIDAKTAFYDKENVTPMAYGFSAHKNRDSIKKDKAVFSFDEVTKKIIKIGK
jgi:nitrous oxide reductase accessory protein NosL